MAQTRYVDTGSTAGGDGTTSATSGANRAYVSLLAAITAMPSPLTEDWTIVCAATGGAADASVASTTGKNLSTFTLTITAAAAHRASRQWSTAKYRLSRAQQFAPVLDLVAVGNTIVEWLQIENTDSTGDNGQSGVHVWPTGTSIHTIQKCFIRSSGNAGGRAVSLHSAAAATGTLRVGNCILKGFKQGVGQEQYGATVSHVLYNVLCYGQSERGINFDNNEGANKWVKNVAIQGTPTACYYVLGGTVNSATDLTEDATSPQVGLRNLAIAFVDEAGGDFGLAAGDTAAKGAGTDLSGDAKWAITDDIDGNVRSVPWNIGPTQDALVPDTGFLELANGTDRLLWANGTDRFLLAGGAASGTQYNNSVSGSITPAGAGVRQGNKVTAGTTTPAGALARQGRGVRAGTVTPAGALVRRGSRVSTGTVTPAGALAGSKFVQASQAGTVTPAGALARRGTKVVGGSVSPTGAMVKQARRSSAGTVTPAAAVAQSLAYIRANAGTVTPAGATTRRGGRASTGTVTPSGATIRRGGKFTAGTVTPAGALTKRGARSSAGTVTPAGALASLKFLLRLNSGTVTPAGSLVRQGRAARAGTVTPTGTSVRQGRRASAGTVTPAGALLRSLAYMRSNAGTVTPAGVLVKRGRGDRAGTVAPSGVLGHQGRRTSGGTITPTGQRNAGYYRNVAGLVAISGVLQRNAILRASHTGSVAPAAVLQHRGMVLHAGTIMATGALSFATDEVLVLLWSSVRIVPVINVYAAAIRTALDIEAMRVDSAIQVKRTAVVRGRAMLALNFSTMPNGPLPAPLAGSQPNLFTVVGGALQGAGGLLSLVTAEMASADVRISTRFLTNVLNQGIVVRYIDDLHWMGVIYRSDTQRLQFVVYNTHAALAPPQMDIGPIAGKLLEVTAVGDRWTIAVDGVVYRDTVDPTYTFRGTRHGFLTNINTPAGARWGDTIIATIGA